ncbi:MAG: hypothetical protein AB8B69_18980 [Chitinophagales bacterium]
MKLRCVQDSIRLRVRKTDLQKLEREGLVRESIDFGGGMSFVFALAVGADVDAVNAVYENGQLQVNIPLLKAKKWMDSNEVGIEVAAAEGQPHILIEKDFPCLDRAEENKADTFWELTGEKPEQC